VPRAAAIGGVSLANSAWHRSGKPSGIAGRGYRSPTQQVSWPASGPAPGTRSRAPVRPASKGIRVTRRRGPLASRPKCSARLPVRSAPAANDEHPRGQASPGRALASAEQRRADRPCRVSLSWPQLSQSPGGDRETTAAATAAFHASQHSRSPELPSGRAITFAEGSGDARRAAAVGVSFRRNWAHLRGPSSPPRFV